MVKISSFKLAFTSLFSFALLVAGLIIPEEKTLILGFHFPYLLYILSFIIVGSSKNDTKAVFFAFAFAFFMLTVFLWSLLLSVFELTHPSSIANCASVTATLGFSVVFAFLLACKSPPFDYLNTISNTILIVGIVFLLNRLIQDDYTREGSFLGLGPLVFTKYISIALILAILHDQSRVLLKLFVYVLILIVSDSKGPILSAIMVIALWHLRTPSFKSIFLFILIGAIVLFYFQFNERANELLSGISGSIDSLGAQRITDTEIERELVSGTQVRLHALHLSAEIIRDNFLLGVGSGGWPLVTGLVSLGYPHNSFAEIWSEYGVFVFVMFLAVSFDIIRGVVCKNNIFSAISLFCLLQSMTSGSARDLRVLFLFYILYKFYNSYESKSCFSIRDSHYKLSTAYPNKLNTLVKPNRL